MAQAILRLSTISPADAEQIRLAVWSPKYSCAVGRCSGPGHTEDAQIPLYDLNGKSYFRFPFHLVRQEIYGWLHWFNHYRAGYLPVAGGLLDQSQAFLDAMAIIRAEVADMEKEP